MENWRNEARDVFLRLREPAQCHLWHMKEPGYLDVGPQTLEKYRVFVESDHYDREIRRCKFCGQLYYYEFYEIDYRKDPDEPIYCTYIPIDDDPALIDRLSAMSPLELLSIAPRMQMDTGYPWVVWKGRPEQPEDKDFQSRPRAPWDDSEDIEVKTTKTIREPLPADHPLSMGWVILPVKILRPDDKQKK